MNALGDLFTAFLFEYPLLWPLYAVGLWHFIIRPMLYGREDLESENNRPVHPIATIVEEIPADPMQGLLARSYNEHLFGEMKKFDGSIKDDASLCNFERFSAHFKKNKIYFDEFLKQHNTGKDEFIGAYWLETKYRFILTNKCLFLADEKLLIPLENIRSINVKGTFSQTLRMTIVPDEEATFKVRGLRSDIFEYLLNLSINEAESLP